MSFLPDLLRFGPAEKMIKGWHEVPCGSRRGGLAGFICQQGFTAGLVLVMVCAAGKAFAQADPKDPIARAIATVEGARGKAEQDSKRPVFHLRPPAQWMNDICGAFFIDGWHHVFYQFNPWSDRWGKGVGWGHARSRDLVSWEILPPALLPDLSNGSELDGSGSAAIDGQGRPILFFTHTPIGYPKFKRQQWAAVPEDEGLLRWKRVDIGLAPGRSGVPEDIPAGWADMFVFRAVGRMLATFKASRGLVCEAVDPGLRQWKAVGQIKEIEGECPNLFPLGGQFALIRSTLPISYLLGDFDAEKVSFRPGEAGPRVLDYGPGSEIGRAARGLYGTNVFIDGQGRAILLGWISGFPEGKGWNGCMSLPRLLRIEEGHLVQAPLPELSILRGARATAGPVTLDSAARPMEGFRSGSFEVAAEFRPGTARACGLRLRSGGGKEIVLRAEGNRWNIAGTETPLSASRGGGVRVQAFFDRSVMDVFLNDGRATVTRHVAHDADEFTLELFAEEGTVEVVSCDAWMLKPIWER